MAFLPGTKVLTTRGDHAIVCSCDPIGSTYLIRYTDDNFQYFTNDRVHGEYDFVDEGNLKNA